MSVVSIKGAIYCPVETNINVQVDQGQLYNSKCRMTRTLLGNQP